MSMFTILSAFINNNYLDFWIIIIGILSAASCALLGNFLVLRKMSLMGDAISHAVLPGLAIAFFFTGSRESIPMFIGAAAVGVITVLIIQLINNFGKVDKSASMGVVFTTLFAIGLILIVKGADSVDLDPSCVLYGSIELTPLNIFNFNGIFIPKAFITLSIIFIINLIFTIVFYKELKISSFDPELSTTLGINSNIMYYMLMSLVAVTTVGSFESVGSILVIAMLIVPAAAAYLLSKRLITMLIMSIAFAVGCAFFGHLSAITVPKFFGFPDTNTSGMMAVVAGCLLLLTLFLAPQRGILIKFINQFKLSINIINEDILGILYRIKDMKSENKLQIIEDFLKKIKDTNKLLLNFSFLSLNFKGYITKKSGNIQLTDSGMNKSRNILRSHRLWESYFYKFVTQNTNNLHYSAHQLEHITDSDMRDKLLNKTGNPKKDPHGKNIP